MTGLTVPALVLVLVAVLRPSAWPWSLAVAGVAPAGVAVVVGGVGIPGFYFVGMFAAAVAGLALVRIMTVPTLRTRAVPGLPMLVAFAVWATVVTFTAPALFPGLAVLGSAPSGPRILMPGAVTSSNVAQVAYLWIATAVIALVASSKLSLRHLVGLTAGGIVVLSFWKYLSDLVSLPFPAELFDNNPAWVYIQTAPGGAERFRGILSEPASLAMYCLAAAAFAVALFPTVAGRQKVGLAALLVVSVWLGIASTSTTFVIAGTALCLLAAGVFGLSLLRPDRQVSTLHVVALLGVVVVLYVVGPMLFGYVNDVVAAKSGSDSYNDRSGADAFSFEIALRTYGLGVGLGANRPSSFVLMLLSNVGLIGTLLFGAAVLAMVRHGLRCEGAGPTVWVLAALLVAKVVSGPDLADTSGLLYLSLGVLAGLRPPAPPTLSRQPLHRSEVGMPRA